MIFLVFNHLEHYFWIILIAFLVVLSSCQSPDISSKATFSIETLQHSLEAGIVNDFFSPPVASRIYVYPHIGAYEVLRQQSQGSFPSFANQLKGLKPIPKADKQVKLPLAAAISFLEIGKRLVYSQDSLNKQLQIIEKKHVKQDYYISTKKYAEQITNHIMQWSAQDNYAALRSYDQHTLGEAPSAWVPTPPDYKEALEPGWKTMRCLVLEKADQFPVGSPTNYDLSTDSKFYTELKQVYEAVNQLSEEQLAIAKFWDCNPLVSVHHGHVVYNDKKLTPGGHWMNIAQIACQQQNLSPLESSYAHSLVAVGIFDAFISCWHEKYRSDFIRPVTLINREIDPNWNPVLQTPNFPEHTSGHSVVSASASTILSHLLGESFSYTDDSEVPYGMPARSYSSFKQAAEEAAISRMYGGIHFMPSIVEGKKQGRQVGQWILKKLSVPKLSEQVPE